MGIKAGLPRTRGCLIIPPCSQDGKLAPYRDGLHFKMSAAQQRRRSNKLARRQLLTREEAAIGGVELVVERQVRAGNLDVNQIIHAHARLYQRGLHVVQKELDFLVDLGWCLSSLVESDPPRQIQRVAGKNSSAERCLRIVVRKADRPPGPLRFCL